MYQACKHPSSARGRFKQTKLCRSKTFQQECHTSEATAKSRRSTVVTQDLTCSHKAISQEVSIKLLQKISQNPKLDRQARRELQFLSDQGQMRAKRASRKSRSDRTQGSRAQSPSSTKRRISQAQLSKPQLKRCNQSQWLSSNRCHSSRRRQ